MKSLLSILTTLSLLLTGSVGGFTTSAQQSSPSQDPFAAPRRDFMQKLPPSARIGASPEAKAAWDQLTPEERTQLVEKFRALFAAAKERVDKENPFQQRPPKTWKEIIRGGQSSADFDVTVAFTDRQGRRQLIRAKEQVNAILDASASAQSLQARLSSKNSDQRKTTARKPNSLWANISGFAPGFSPFRKASFVKASATAMLQGGADADVDGLPDDFENQVADAFTPIYHVSAGEQPGTGFATFGDYVPQTVQQVFPPVPPISHFRVQPLGFAYNSYGQLVSVLRIDYLTLWNRDDGLDIDSFCRFNLDIALGLIGIGVGAVLDGLRAHPLDNERSAVLVAAPVSGYYFNTDPWAYNAYSFFTTAHEGEPFTDQSTFLYPYQPLPAGSHIHLGLSRSKHGTYAFNPDGYPLIQFQWIYLYFSTIDFLYAIEEIDWYTYLYFSYVGNVAFFSCGVEQFQEQGGTYAGVRINVGEPSNPINGSHFIQATELYNKLTRPLWQ